MAKPKHIAFIVDGNRRWAKKHLLSALFGHKQGVKVLKRTLLDLLEENIQFASFYCFSTENWSRSQEEVNWLIKLINEYFSKGINFFTENNIKVKIFGDISRFPENTQKILETAQNSTATCQKLIVGFCLNYGGREDIIQAVNQLIKEGKSFVNQNDISAHLYTKDFPDPDLIIRTSGEQRLSNFMLWQSSYSELYFPKILWPNFNKRYLKIALQEFSKRVRRFGGN